MKFVKLDDDNIIDVESICGIQLIHSPHINSLYNWSLKIIFNNGATHIIENNVHECYRKLQASIKKWC